VERHFHSPNTPSWRGAQLKAQAELYLYRYSIHVERLVFVDRMNTFKNKTLRKKMSLIVIKYLGNVEKYAKRSSMANTSRPVVLASSNEGF
jgi:hypothetical protein